MFNIKIILRFKNNLSTVDINYLIYNWTQK